MGDNIDLPDRNGVRTPMQWDDSPYAGFTRGKPFTEFVQGELSYYRINVASQMADKTSLFYSISKMVHVRKEHHAFGRGSMRWIETGNPAIVGYVREDAEESLLIFHNLSDVPQTISLDPEVQGSALDLLTDADVSIQPSITFQPYSYRWLKQDGK
jgi:maltose alpha-D-glucosyltransferase/alpha-amylase